MPSGHTLTLPLADILGELMGILNDKERHIITRRFSLHNRPKETLERIGKSFSITRERVRQIENAALRKLQRNSEKSELRHVSAAALAALNAGGGVQEESALIGTVLRAVHTQETPINGHIIRLALALTTGVDRGPNTGFVRRFWFLPKSMPLPRVMEICNACVTFLERRGQTANPDDFANAVRSALRSNPPPVAAVHSMLLVDRRLRQAEDSSWGLTTWRHINPRSIRDKAVLTLRKLAEPVHFIALANAITAANFEGKKVTVQAVHNELIRHEEFVLVGRGVYALKEWGYEPGTVAEVIARILEKEGPLARREIIDRVQQQREVQETTISFFLQKNPAFTRVGRSVYGFDKSQWVPPTGRGRASKRRKAAQL